MVIINIIIIIMIHFPEAMVPRRNIFFSRVAQGVGIFVNGQSLALHNLLLRLYRLFLRKKQSKLRKCSLRS